MEYASTCNISNFGWPSCGRFVVLYIKTQFSLLIIYYFIWSVNWFKSYGRKDWKYAKTWQGIISCPIRCPIFVCSGANKSLRFSVSSTPCQRLGSALLLYFWSDICGLGRCLMSVMAHRHLCFTMKITLVKGYYLMIFWVIKQKSRTSGGDRF